MAGHSKWANIQHRKGAQDKKRAALFARLSKEITIASKLGLPHPDANPPLLLSPNPRRPPSTPSATHPPTPPSLHVSHAPAPTDSPLAASQPP